MAAPTLVPAAEWRRQTWQPLGRTVVPTRENWVHHSGPGQKTFATLLANERYHVATLGWRALGYSFAVTVDRIDRGFARIFEGRGWGAAGGHTSGRNTVSHAVLLVGNWETATADQVEAAAQSVAWLMRRGAELGHTIAVVTGGHRQAPGASTACPGTGGMRVAARARQLLASPSAIPSAPAGLLERIAAMSDAQLAAFADQVGLRAAHHVARLKPASGGSDLLGAVGNASTHARNASAAAREAAGAIEELAEQRNWGNDAQATRLALRALLPAVGVLVEMVTRLAEQEGVEVPELERIRTGLEVLHEVPDAHRPQTV